MILSESSIFTFSKNMISAHPVQFPILSSEKSLSSLTFPLTETETFCQYLGPDLRGTDGARYCF